MREARARRSQGACGGHGGHRGTWADAGDGDGAPDDGNRRRTQRGAAVPRGEGVVSSRGPATDTGRPDFPRTGGVLLGRDVVDPHRAGVGRGRVKQRCCPLREARERGLARTTRTRNACARARTDAEDALLPALRSSAAAAAPLRDGAVVIKLRGAVYTHTTDASLRSVFPLDFKFSTSPENELHQSNDDHCGVDLYCTFDDFFPERPIFFIKLLSLYLLICAINKFA